MARYGYAELRWSGDQVSFHWTDGAQLNAEDLFDRLLEAESIWGLSQRQYKKPEVENLPGGFVFSGLAGKGIAVGWWLLKIVLRQGWEPFSVTNDTLATTAQGPALEGRNYHLRRLLDE